eukprot:1156816-Pelagomonas_calceolata.AAC.2
MRLLHERRCGVQETSAGGSATRAGPRVAVASAHQIEASTGGAVPALPARHAVNKRSKMGTYLPK